MAKRPIRSRVWFWKPQWYWCGWSTLLPFSRGGDEFDWHTIVLGWTVTGRVIFAVRPCPRTGRCADFADPTWPRAEWPIDLYGCDHTDPTAFEETA